MLTIRPGVLRDIALQSTTELAVVLVNMVVNRERMFGRSFKVAVRPHWTAEVLHDAPEAVRHVFVYDAATGEQEITVCSNPEQPFVLAIARLAGEPEIEALIVGDGFAMHTRHLLRADWSPIDDDKARALGAALYVLSSFP